VLICFAGRSKIEPIKCDIRDIYTSDETQDGLIQVSIYDSAKDKTIIKKMDFKDCLDKENMESSSLSIQKELLYAVLQENTFAVCFGKAKLPKSLAENDGMRRGSKQMLDQIDEEISNKS